MAGIVLTVAGAGGTIDPQGKPGADEPGKLWAAIGISKSVFDPETWTIDRPKVHLILVNDRTHAIETGVRESVLVVNGKPRPGEAWDAALEKGLGGNTSEKLRPGEQLEVVCPLQEVITEPGIYRVSWRAKNFESSEAVYRLMPRAGESDAKPAAAKAGNKSGPPKAAEGSMWAVISIVPPVSASGTSTKGPVWIELHLGNDGTQTVDTGADDSVLVVNGQPLRSRDWQVLLSSGPFSGDWPRMPPRRHTGIIRNFDGIITEPGIYRVSWRGKNFQSHEVMYRVLPAKNN
jgi:hypothetical protein